MYRPSARAEVVAGLIATGGVVENSSGRTTLQLVQQVAEVTGETRSTPAMTELLSAMHDEGQIHRVTRGRRTYAIALASVDANLLTEARDLLVANGYGRDEADDLIVDAGFPVALDPDTPGDAPQTRMPATVATLEDLPGLVGTLVETLTRQQEHINRLAGELGEARAATQTASRRSG